VKTSRMILVAFVAVATVGLLAGPASASLLYHYGLNETVNPSTGTTAVDSAGHQNGTYLGAVGATVGVASADAALFSTAATFNGADDVVDIAPLGQLTDNFTVALWVKPGSLRQEWLLAPSVWPNGGWCLGYGSDSGGTQMKLYSCATGASYNAVYAGPTRAEADVGKWQHVAFTFDSTNGVNWYVNGLLQSDNPYVASPGAETANYRIGVWDDDDTRVWDGGIDEVRVYDEVISAGDIYQLAGSPPIPTPEPSTIMLSSLALLGLLAYAWRKRK
jgi:hypothetical protein